MKTFFTSDNHFGHARIIELVKRPFRDVEEMELEMVERWNSVVTPDDEVYHLGDFAFGNKQYIKRIRAKLNGRVHLILGNHDRPIPAMLDCGFENVTKDGYVTARVDAGHPSYFYLGHRPADWRDLLSRHRELEIVAQIHGHIHDKATFLDEHHVNVSVERWDYTPVSFDKLYDEWAKHLRSLEPTPEWSEPWNSRSES